MRNNIVQQFNDDPISRLIVNLFNSYNSNHIKLWYKDITEREIIILESNFGVNIDFCSTINTMIDETKIMGIFTFNEYYVTELKLKESFLLPVTEINSILREKQTTVLKYMPKYIKPFLTKVFNYFYTTCIPGSNEVKIMFEASIGKTKHSGKDYKVFELSYKHIPLNFIGWSGSSGDAFQLNSCMEIKHEYY